MAAFASVGHLATTPFPGEVFLSFTSFSSFFFGLFCPMVCFLTCFLQEIGVPFTYLLYVTNKGEPTLC
jgi:hypothetical protein